MSRPGGPYRDEQGRQYPPQRYPDQSYPDQRYPQQQGYQGGYQQGGYDQSYDQGYDRRPAAPQRPQERQRPEPPPRYDDDSGGGFRLPGLGLLLSVLGLVVQLVSFTVLPWVTSSASNDSEALPAIWDLAKDFDARGFSGAYVLMFSYPLAVLGILLSLVAVLESVAMKVIWAVLALIGIAALALRFGFVPFGEMISGDQPLEFSRQELTLAIVALAALVVVIFMLKMAMSTFRRLAGLVLLVIAGVHVAAVSDLTDGFGYADVRLGAYGPAVGYALAAVAAFVGPRRVA
jgi:hypothetical protein